MNHLIIDGVTYTVERKALTENTPKQRLGVGYELNVIARKEGQEIWKTKIYTRKYDLETQTSLQDFGVRSFEFKNGAIYVTLEAPPFMSYTLDPKTGTVVDTHPSGTDEPATSQTTLPKKISLATIIVSGILIATGIILLLVQFMGRTKIT